MDTSRRIELLRSTRFFQESPESLLRELAGGCDEVDLEPGQILFEQGDPGDALYIVDEGVLEVYIGETPLDESRRGECLGEMALVTDERRSASIRAKEASHLLRLPRAIFRAAINRNPELAWGVIRELAAKVKSSIRVRVEQHQHQLKLEEAFARSVSRAVMDELMGSRNSVELMQGTNKQVTTLFADVRSFSSLSERLKPEVLIQLLNEYLAGMVEVILDHGGTLDRFAGDGILAHFGIPLPGRKDALRAVQCAMAMQNRLAEMNHSGKHLPQHPLTIGIGLATGMVVAGVVGSDRRMEYTAIGDVVQLSAQVERLTPIYGCELLMCDETARQIGSDLLLREVDRVRLKSRNRPTHIYDLLAPLELATAAEVKRLSSFRFAFAVYASGRFEEAAGQFDELARAFPQDGPAMTLAERCRRYQASPPPEGWNCVFEAEDEG